MTEFNKYLKEARQEFCKEVSKYNVSDNLELRTACDSFLIAFDQASEKAINYTRCCTELKDIEENNIEIKTLGDLKRVYPEGKLHTVNGYGKIINYSVDGEIVYTRHL